MNILNVLNDQTIFWRILVVKLERYCPSSSLIFLGSRNCFKLKFYVHAYIANVSQNKMNIFTLFIFYILLSAYNVINADHLGIRHCITPGLVALTFGKRKLVSSKSYLLNKSKKIRVNFWFFFNLLKMMDLLLMAKPKIFSRCLKRRMWKPHFLLPDLSITTAIMSP